MKQILTWKLSNKPNDFNAVFVGFLEHLQRLNVLRLSRLSTQSSSLRFFHNLYFSTEVSTLISSTFRTHLNMRCAVGSLVVLHWMSFMFVDFWSTRCSSTQSWDWRRWLSKVGKRVTSCPIRRRVYRLWFHFCPTSKYSSPVASIRNNSEPVSTRTPPKRLISSGRFTERSIQY